jgi:hypothetical protein
MKFLLNMNMPRSLAKRLQDRLFPSNDRRLGYRLAARRGSA